MYPFADIVAGTLLLVLGRKLFWLFVGIAGFYVGFEVARTVAMEQPVWLVWTIAIGAGLIGAVLAILLQRVGFAIAGWCRELSLTLNELENDRTILDSGSDDANHVDLLLPRSHAGQR